MICVTVFFLIILLIFKFLFGWIIGAGIPINGLTSKLKSVTNADSYWCTERGIEQFSAYQSAAFYMCLPKAIFNSPDVRTMKKVARDDFKCDMGMFDGSDSFGWDGDKLDSSETPAFVKTNDSNMDLFNRFWYLRSDDPFGACGNCTDFNVTLLAGTPFESTVENPDCFPAIAAWSSTCSNVPTFSSLSNETVVVGQQTDLMKAAENPDCF